MTYLKFYLPHLIFFGVYLAALLPVLYYYSRKNPNPKFRPRAGEIALIAAAGILLGGMACYGLGNVFRGDVSFKQYEGKFDNGAGWSEGDSAPPAPDPRFSK